MTVYYVDGNNGNNNNNGLSLAAAFATIARGAQAATSPGDIVYILNKTGGYHEEVDIRAQGTSANPIIFQAYSGHSPFMDGRAQGNSNDNLPVGPIPGYATVPASLNSTYAGRAAKDTGLLDFIGAHYIVWDSIDIRRSGGRGIRVLSSASNITIKNITVFEPRGIGVLIDNSSYVTCESVYVDTANNFAPFRRAPTQLDWSGAFTTAGSVQNVTLDKCTVDTNWGEHMMIGAQRTAQSGIIIRNCVLFDSIGALYIHGPISNVIVENNYFYRSATTPHVLNGEGLNLSDVEPQFSGASGAPSNVYIRNNIFAGLRATACAALNISASSTSNVHDNYTFANNTIVNCEGKGIGTWGTVNGRNIKFLNNIIYQPGQTRVSTSFTNTAQVTANNDYWSGAPEQAWFRGANDVVSAASPVVNYQHNPARGQGDAGNFRLVSGSAAINAGANLSADFKNDFYGNTRGANWDIGAHEYGGGAPEPAFITADFSASTRTGPAPLTITFSDQSKSSGPINAWLWDFGDGSAPSNAQNPTHTYREAGQFTVKLQVNGPAGEDTAIKLNYITGTEEEEPPPPPPPPGEKQRVTTGQQALYDFSEGSGLVVIDRANAGAPLNLTIEEGGAVRWLEGGGLELRPAARLKSDGAARKVIDACRQAGAITVEAWIKPANVTQSGPARILSISGGSTSRNVMLGQGLWGDQPTDLFDARLRTTERDANGAPSVSSPAGTAAIALTHVVYTRAQDGTAAIYVNGAAVVSAKVPGDFSNWDAGFPLLLGNENGDDRPWLGELHLAAIYARALSAAEVAQNYQAGIVRPPKPAVVTAQFTVPAAQTQGVSPHRVTFDATGSSAPLGIAAYAWTFGDGGTAETTNPIYTYTYKRSGLFDVTLEVADKEGNRDRQTRAQLIQVEPMPTRVTAGLQALYTFQEGQGAVVRDVSNVGQALNLTIRDAAAVRWLPDGLAVEAPTAIVSASAAGKIINACKASSALTVEAWVTPANAVQQGPARILSISKDPYERNITLAQGLWAQQPPDVYDVRLRTTQTSANGIPSLTSPAGSLKVERTHVVYTRGADGQARIYLNGKLAVETQIAGDFSSWDDGYSLRLVSEGEAARPWLGRLHLGAIYARALSADDVTQNYRAGLTEVEKEYTPPLLPETPATFRRFLLLRSEGGNLSAENESAPPAPTGYGVQYPNLRCVLLWKGAQVFEIYDDLTALQAVYPNQDTMFIWLDE
jgi:PKD repeat protein